MIFFSIEACRKIEVPTDTPNCIKRKIRQWERDGKYAKSDVEKWTIDGTDYFVFPTPTISADAFTDMYNTSCELVCHPSGGLIGGGSGDCPDLTNAQVTVIYTFKE